MDKAKLKRMTRRTEFYMFLVLILLCVVVQIKSGGKLFMLPASGDHAQQHHEEAVQRVGVFAGVAGHDGQRVKGAVHEAVAIHQQHFRGHVGPSCRHSFHITLYYTTDRASLSKTAG